MEHEVTWFTRANGGFSALVNGEVVCFEPCDEALQRWASRLSYEEAINCLIEIYNETAHDDEYLYDE